VERDSLDAESTQGEILLLPSLGRVISYSTESTGNPYMLFQSSELGPPTPSPASECVSPQDPSWGETHSLAGERVPTVGQKLWYSI
jgi:hypothetical protein